jgi:glucokinase
MRNRTEDLASDGAAIGLDIGATKVTAAVVRSGKVVQRATALTAGDPDPWVAVQTTLDSLEIPADAVGVGCGCCGPMSPGGVLVSPVNITAWRDFPLAARLSDATGLPAVVDNDVKVMALGEWRYGAAAGVDNFLAMVVSSGIGGGLVVDGRLLEGSGGNAGHIGHVVVEPDGRRCGCGSQGCVEAEVSGMAIERITGRPPAEASEEWRVRAGTLVGRAIATAAVLLDLDLAVVGGSVALGFGEPFFAAAQAEIDQRCQIEFSRKMRVVPTTLGPDAALLGAAALVTA